jgi:hypothetical protein
VKRAAAAILVLSIIAAAPLALVLLACASIEGAADLAAALVLKAEVHAMAGGTIGIAFGPVALIFASLFALTVQWVYKGMEPQ